VLDFAPLALPLLVENHGGDADTRPARRIG